MPPLHGLRARVTSKRMQILPTALPDVKLLRHPRHGDARGWFGETFRADLMARAGLLSRFVQDNQSFSAQVGTVRGLHFQREPHAQVKLVRVLMGRILDVVVDCRAGSPDFGRHVAVELSAETGDALYVPAGFAHGFCTLVENSLVAYKCGAYYAPDCEGGLLWNDPALGIEWPVDPDAATLSQKDRLWPRLADLEPLQPR